jgi:hypothetical protein
MTNLEIGFLIFLGGALLFALIGGIIINRSLKEQEKNAGAKRN